MADESHDPESYRLLFGLIGAAFLAVVLMFILASALVAPGWVVAVLSVLWLGAVILSIRAWPDRSWMPLLVGTALAVLWIAAVSLIGNRS